MAGDIEPDDYDQDRLDAQRELMDEVDRQRAEAADE